MTEPSVPATDDEQRLEIRDPQLMRALAHPARLAIVEHLSTGRTGTATEVARVCGLSPSATSYHLRALAKFGLVEEAPSRGDGRERVWRSKVRGYTVTLGLTENPEAQAASRALAAVFLARENRRAREWIERSGGEPPEWFDAATFSEGVLVLTAAELSALSEAVVELFRPYTRQRRTDPPPGARLVSAAYRAFPLEEPAMDDRPLTGET